MPIERPSDREFPCFFCFKGKTKSRSDVCPECGAPIDIGPALEGTKVEAYLLKDHVARGYYGVTFRAENRIGHSFAVKLVPARLYEQHDKSFDDEIRKYRRLGTHPHIAELIDASAIDIELLSVNISFYYIVMEWVNGTTLTDYLNTAQHISAQEVFGIVLDVAAGLTRFENENLWHNDLNSDNILLAPLNEDERLTRRVDTPYTCKIVDTGSAVFRQNRLPGRLADLTFFGHHINDLRKAALADESALTREDQFFFHNLERIVARLFDENSARGLPNAQALSREVEELYKQRYMLNETTDVSLLDPFAYLNANDFPNDAFINYLFSGLFPWVRDIVTPEAQGMLITGPRGSGKTMILRSMRFKTRLHPFSADEEPQTIRQRVKDDHQLAFFVSARIEIGNHCALSKLPHWASSEELIVYYFFLLYAVEVLDTLYYGQAKGLLSFDRVAEAAFCKYLCAALGLEEAVNIVGALTKVRSKQYAIERDKVGAVPEGVMLTSGFLSALVKNIRQLSSLFARKAVIFLLDDFSSPKIPVHIQRTLLPLIWNSGGGYSFRVSAHSESVVTEDLRQNHYQVSREFREINLGAAYLNSIDVSRNEDVIDAYVSDIFSRRFSISETYQDTSFGEMLGPDYPGKIAQEIYERHNAKTLRGLRYFGRNTLIKLCSGDISYLIDMLGQMLRTDTEVPIGPERQHRVIKQYAWKELYRLQDGPNEHCELYPLALNFGKWSLFKLIHSAVGGGKRPAEYLRLEVELDGEIEPVRSTIAELLQTGVFVDGGFSNSSRGIPARRLLFRKIFTPAFPTTYNSRDTFAMNARRFLELTRNPERFVKAMLGEDGVIPDEQQSLLDTLMDPVG